MAGVELEAIVSDYLITTTTKGRATEEGAAEAVCASFGTTTEQAFRAAAADLDVQPLLTALSPDARTAILTWRGTLAAPDGPATT